MKIVVLMYNSKRILVADDDPAIVEAIDLILQLHDYTVASTVDGKVLSMMKSFKPDLVLLDIWMSGVDGRDICRKIKSDESMKEVPVIMISASKDVIESSKVAGAEDFLAKPFEMDELIKKVETLLITP